MNTMYRVDKRPLHIGYTKHTVERTDGEFVYPVGMDAVPLKAQHHEWVKTKKEACEAIVTACSVEIAHDKKTMFGIINRIKRLRILMRKAYMEIA